MYTFKSYLLGMLAVASLAVVTGCNDKIDDKPSPTISLSGPGANGGTRTVGEPYDVRISANSNGGSNLEKSEVLFSHANTPPDANTPPVFSPETVIAFYSTSGINQATFVDTFDMPALMSGIDKITFRVTNKDGKTAQKSVTFTIATETPNSYAGVVMGGSQNSIGHFFSAQSGQVLSPAQALSASEKVDIVFYHENTSPNSAHGATLAAPANFTAQSIYSGMSMWPTRNNTTFKMGTASDMLISTNSGLAQAYADATVGGGVTMRNLEIDDVVLFKTEGGKYGVLQITQLNTSPSNAQGTIRFNAKVQP